MDHQRPGRGSQADQARAARGKSVGTGGTAAHLSPVLIDLCGRGIRGAMYLASLIVVAAAMAGGPAAGEARAQEEEADPLSALVVPVVSAERAREAGEVAREHAPPEPELVEEETDGDGPIFASTGAQDGSTDGDGSIYGNEDWEFDPGSSGEDPSAADGPVTSTEDFASVEQDGATGEAGAGTPPIGFEDEREVQSLEGGDYEQATAPESLTQGYEAGSQTAALDQYADDSSQIASPSGPGSGALSQDDDYVPVADHSAQEEPSAEDGGIPMSSGAGSGPVDEIYSGQEHPGEEQTMPQEEQARDDEGTKEESAPEGEQSLQLASSGQTPPPDNPQEGASGQTPQELPEVGSEEGPGSSSTQSVPEDTPDEGPNTGGGEDPEEASDEVIAGIPITDRPQAAGPTMGAGEGGGDAQHGHDPQTGRQPVEDLPRPPYEPGEQSPEADGPDTGTPPADEPPADAPTGESPPVGAPDTQEEGGAAEQSGPQTGQPPAQEPQTGQPPAEDMPPSSGTPDGESGPGGDTDTEDGGESQHTVIAHHERQGGGSGHGSADVREMVEQAAGAGSTGSAPDPQQLEQEAARRVEQAAAEAEEHTAGRSSETANQVHDGGAEDVGRADSRADRQAAKAAREAVREVREEAGEAGRQTWREVAQEVDQGSRHPASPGKQNPAEARHSPQEGGSPGDGGRGSVRPPQQGAPPEDVAPGGVPPEEPAGPSGEQPTGKPASGRIVEQAPGCRPGELRILEDTDCDGQTDPRFEPRPLRAPDGQPDDGHDASSGSAHPPEGDPARKESDSAEAPASEPAEREATGEGGSGDPGGGPEDELPNAAGLMGREWED